MKFSLSGSIKSLLIKTGFKKPPLPQCRKIFVGNANFIDNNDHSFNQSNYPYPNNYIKSSRYTIFNFLPKNLFEQFQRIANFYFLCIALIQFFIETSVPVVLNIFPLFFVICATMIKQGYEDVLRHKADAEVNNLQVQVFRNGQLTKIKSRDIVVGDIVYCETNETFPCDLVLLSTSEPSGNCYVTTASLDGETNLKLFMSASKTRFIRHISQLNLNSYMVIECEHPIEDLYRFEGRMHPYDDPHNVSPLISSNLVLRGARLRNTAFIVGCAVYTGQDTKMALNSCRKQAKFSQVELRLNLFLVAFLLLLLLAAIVCTSLKFMSIKSIFANSFYVQREDVAPWKVVETFLTFIVLFNYLIPISLYVTIELQKFFGSMFFGWDANMYDEKSDLCAKSITSDLNEELGQIEFLFSDKTGTLTENEMQFRQASIGGVKYRDEDGLLMTMTADGGQDGYIMEELPEDVVQFFTILSLCHTVRVEKTPDGRKEYQASSPDEKAFLEASRQYGITFQGQNDDGESEITYFHNKETPKRFKILAVLPFDSHRKRMSVVVENDDGSIDLHCKGAENAMISQASSFSNVDTVMQHVTDYAVEGLRTLVVGTRPLSRQQFESLNAFYNASQSSLVNRDQELSECYNAFETELFLLGCTGVEDKLQDGVKETLSDLRDAGIQTWVLTGDKEETAVNISYSTGHFSPGIQEVRITKQIEIQSCLTYLNTQLERMIMSKNQDPNVKFATIIDGQSLNIAIKPVVMEKLRSIFLECVAVLCCRMTPLQKSEVVSLIKSSRSPSPVTASIGDGANDVSMILEAHIGIGLYGKEGRQAVRAADYALPRFKFLRNALLVHGHYYYIRIATLVQYFFYKNTAFIGPQFYFSFFSGFSAQTVYESLYLVLYNITLTSLPIFIYGLLEKHVSIKTLLQNPKLYRNIRQNASLSWRTFLRWNFFGFWHSLVAIFGPIILLLRNDIITTDGQNLRFHYFGTIILMIVWITTSLKLCLVTYFYNWATLAGFGLTFVGNLTLLIMYQGLFLTEDTYEVFWIWFELFCQPSAWIFIFIFVLISLIPDISYRLIQDEHFRRKNSIEESNIKPHFAEESSDQQCSRNKPSTEKASHPNTFDNGGFEIDNWKSRQNALHANLDFCYSNISGFSGKPVYVPK